MRRTTNLNPEPSLPIHPFDFSQQVLRFCKRCGFPVFIFYKAHIDRHAFVEILKPGGGQTDLLFLFRQEDRLLLLDAVQCQFLFHLCAPL